MTCPKCGEESGDDWSQCRKACPMKGSPHYSVVEAARWGQADTVSVPLADFTDWRAQLDQEKFMPCPTCHQYSHSIGAGLLVDAYLHFEMMFAHPVRGHPMGHVFDDKTRDMVQRLIAHARALEVEIMQHRKPEEECN